MEGAIGRCKEAREFIMAECMTPAIAEPRPDVSKYAPRINFMQIDPEKIGDVVGQRGKTINEIIKRTGVAIDIDDDGKISICGNDAKGMADAQKMIEIITTEFEEGMVHISKIANRRIEHVEDVLTLGDKVTVVCLGKDRMGRLSFSMKDVKNYKKGNK